MKRKRSQDLSDDLFAASQPGEPATGRRIYTVSEVMAEAKSAIEGAYPDVCVQGEVSGYMMASSGHIYFDVKDESALLRVVFFKGSQRGLKFTIENGLKVLVYGSLTIYEGRSSFQMRARAVEPAGIGALQLRIEQLKKKLEAEGLFDPAGKRPIPAFPQSIAVVTSPEGAAIKDFLKVTRRRFPGQRIVIFPAVVQGDDAPAEIAEAIGDANAMGGFDVLVVCRGGGSMEDLQAFNDEAVARAIAGSEIPVVTGIGHERDFTIADFVADVRASTPSQAGELVTPDARDLLEQVDALGSRMAGTLRGLVEDMAQELDDAGSDLSRAAHNLLEGESRGLAELGRRLEALSPRRVLAGRRDFLVQLAGRLAAAGRNGARQARGALEALGGKLHAMSPLAVLGRGYGIVFTGPGNRIVREAGQVRPGADITVRLAKGLLKAQVRQTEEEK